MRFDASRDLTPEGYALALPMLNEIERLENQWVHDGDDETYTRWRELLTEIQAILAPHYVGRNKSHISRR
jgi:hypothetical protein